MRIVPLPEVFRVKYGLRPSKWNLKIKKNLPRKKPKNQGIHINQKQPLLSDAYYQLKKLFILEQFRFTGRFK